MYFNMAVENSKSKCSYVYFAEQYLANLISGLLEVERMNQSYVGAELYERLWLYFYSATSLSFLADEGRKSKKYLQLFQMILGLV